MRKILLGFVSGLIVGVFGYLHFDENVTPDGVVIEAAKGEVLYAGTFADADAAHTAQGSFKIVSTGDGGRAIYLSDDFMIVGAPDPHVEINGQLIAKTTHGGAQFYPIPNTVEEGVTSVNIFCKIAGINLALGTIK